jgi:hypothetical protein
VATEAAWLNGNNLEKEGKGLTLTGLLMEGTDRLYLRKTVSASIGTALQDIGLQRSF